MFYIYLLPQIIIEAAMSNSRICAIAIDDVELSNGDECSEKKPERNETTLTDGNPNFFKIVFFK